jgi:hypothetical protein
MSNAKTSYLDLSASLQEQFQVTGSELTFASDKDTYNGTLPETFGETGVEQADGVHKHDVLYKEAFVHAGGTKGLDVLKTNAELSHVNASTKIGSSVVDVTVKRVGQVSIPPKEKGQEATIKEVVGYTTVKQTTKNGAAINRIKSGIAEAAAELLK